MSQSIVPQGRLTALKYLPYKGLETSSLWFFTHWSQLQPESSLIPHRRALGKAIVASLTPRCPPAGCTALVTFLTSRSSSSISAQSVPLHMPCCPHSLGYVAPKHISKGGRTDPILRLFITCFLTLSYSHPKPFKCPFPLHPSRAVLLTSPWNCASRLIWMLSTSLLQQAVAHSTHKQTLSLLKHREGDKGADYIYRQSVYMDLRFLSHTLELVQVSH